MGNVWATSRKAQDDTIIRCQRYRLLQRRQPLEGAVLPADSGKGRNHGSLGYYDIMLVGGGGEMHRHELLLRTFARDAHYEFPADLFPAVFGLLATCMPANTVFSKHLAERWLRYPFSPMNML